MSDQRAYWDNQFKFSQIIADFAEQLAGLETASHAFAQTADLKRTEYGSDARQWFETIGNPSDSELVVVLVHGGYWRALRAEDHRICLKGLQTLSPCVANVEYRLMPDVRMQDVVSDVTSALQALLEQMDAAAKLLIVGHSAGAHLGLMAGQDETLAPRLAGIIAISGVYDLAPIAKSFLQDELSLTEAEIQSFSLTAAPQNPPALCVVGADETDIFHLQAGEFAATSGSPLVRISESNHMNILRNLAEPDAPFVAAISGWLKGTAPSETIKGYES